MLIKYKSRLNIINNMDEWISKQFGLFGEWLDCFDNLPALIKSAIGLIFFLSVPFYLLLAFINLSSSYLLKLWTLILDPKSLITEIPNLSSGMDFDKVIQLVGRKYYYYEGHIDINGEMIEIFKVLGYYGPLKSFSLLCFRNRKLESWGWRTRGEIEKAYKKRTCYEN